MSVCLARCAVRFRTRTSRWSRTTSLDWRPCSTWPVWTRCRAGMDRVHPFLNTRRESPSSKWPIWWGRWVGYHCSRCQVSPGVMGRRIDPSWGEPIELFLVPFKVLHDSCNKGRGMCYPVCGMVHIKEPLLLIGKSRLCGDSGFPFSLSEWSLTICLTPYNRK